MPCDHCTLIIRYEDGSVIPPLVMESNGVVQNTCFKCRRSFSPEVQQLLDGYARNLEIKKNE